MSRWFRVYDDILDDPKVQLLSPEQFRTWMNLLALASRNAGKLPPLQQMAFALRIAAADMQARLDELVLAGLIDIMTDKSLEPHNWSKRQWKSDDSKERVRKFREKKQRETEAEQHGSANVTVTVTPPDTEADTDSEPEKKNPLTPLVVVASAREGETAAGHGVFVNCETIRHAAFTISIPAIEMGALAAGLTRDEIKTECLSHALQWAVEIEGGKAPRDVLPGKIKNFLCASVMGTKNRADVQSVRVRRADAGASKALVPAESRVQRIMRLCEEAGERMGLNERVPS